MADKYKIVCNCGCEGSAKFYEKDSPYSAWGIWDFKNIDCKSDRVQKAGYMTILEAINDAEPICSGCGMKLNEQHFIQINK